jgi:hypothetical protein
MAYILTLHTNSDTSQEAASAITSANETQPDDGYTAEEAAARAAEHGVNGTLTDAQGLTRGWVTATGTWQLT